MSTFFIGDLHLGEKDMAERRGFSGIQEHDNHILNSIDKTVTKRDILYILGDVARTVPALFQLKEINDCRKILVRGNHDDLHLLDYLEIFEDIYGCAKYKNFWLSHIPIHPSEMWGKHNIHGHCHRVPSYGLEYYNVCAEMIHYVPVNLELIRADIKIR